MKQKKSATVCGRCGCILFYTGKDCVFCPAADDILQNVRAPLEVEDDVVCRIDIENLNGDGLEAPVTTIPMIQICDTTITGIPDESSVRDALIAMHVKSCYYESQNVRLT
ncbi:MAG: hypothetical protein ACXADC_13030 [Candidatus Thorarchaeota archaeon]|jgi:hypothetical protein